MIEGRVRERVELVVRHRGQHCAAQLLAGLQDDQVPRVGSRLADHVDEAACPPGRDDARHQDVPQAPDGRVGQGLQIRVRRRLGLEVVADVGRVHGVEARDGHRIDDRRAERLQVGKGAVEHGAHLAVIVRLGIGLRVQRVADDSDARPAQPAGLQIRGVRVGDAAGRVRGDRVLRVVARDGVEHERGVADGAGYRPQRIAGRIGRHHAEAADQRHGGAQTDERVDRCRAPGGAARVLADADQPEVGRDAGARPAGRAAGIARRVVGVADDAEGRPDVAGRELAHVRLGQDDGAGRLQAGDDGGVPPGHEAVEQGRAVRGRQVARLDLILEQHRRAVQRADGARLGEGRVQRVGRLPCARIDVLDGVQRRAGLVVRRDPVEVALHQLAAGQPPRRQRRVHVVDGRLEQLEGLRAGDARRQQAGNERNHGRRSPCRRQGGAARSRACCHHEDPASLFIQTGLRPGPPASACGDPTPRAATAEARTARNATGGPPPVPVRARRPGCWACCSSPRGTRTRRGTAARPRGTR